MPVKIHTTGPLVSNKPQEPKPVPSASLFPTKLEMKDGRTVWVSLPQPDRLTLLGELGDHTFSKKVPAGSDVVGVLKSLGDYLLDNPFNSHQVDFWWNPTKGYHHYITLALGERGTHVRFEPVPPKAGKGWRYRIEMNPRKLGFAGTEQLCKILGASEGPFDLPAFASTCRVMRLDVALDIVGLRVSETILGHKKQGKRSCYIGDDGTLETFMVHRKKPPQKAKLDQFGDPKKLFHSSQPAGQVLLKAYDRVRERAVLLKPAPFGPAPVTRVEITLQRLGTKGMLKDLAALPNPFQLATVALVPTQPTANNAVWWQYVSLRRVSDPAAVAALLGLGEGTAAAFELSLSSPAEVLDTSELWNHWAVSLGEVGLAAFVAGAAS